MKVIGLATTLAAVGAFALDARAQSTLAMRLWVAGLLGLLLMTNSSMAQSRWRIVCSTDKMTDKQSCVVDKGYWPKIEEPYIHLVYALEGRRWGAYTSDPVRRLRVRVDDNPVLSSSACGRSACAFDASISELLLGQIKSGKMIKIELTTINDRVVGPYDLSTDGFQEVWARALAGEKE